MGNFMTKRDYEIDVVMLTKNSNKSWFKRVLTAIKREIPVHHFIVVDGYSTDGTIEIVRELFGSKIVVIKTLSPLGCARYYGMKAVDTEWFAFIDSDVEILPGWFKSALKYMSNPRVYGIQGLYRVYKENTKACHIKYVQPVISPKENLNVKNIIIHGIVKLYGADTAHVLLRRDVLNLINPAFICSLDCGEDAYIAWKIVEAGFLYIKSQELQAIHYTNFKINLDKILHRSSNYNGIFYAIPLKAYILSNFLRFLSSLFKRKPETLSYLVGLAGGPLSWIKTRRLMKYMGA
jgi:glycosyltransferase involved in cell wall biosynthesis